MPPLWRNQSGYYFGLLFVGTGASYHKAAQVAIESLYHGKKSSTTSLKCRGES